MAETTTTLDVKRFLSSMSLRAREAPTRPVRAEDLQQDTAEVPEEDRFLASLAVLIHNSQPGKTPTRTLTQSLILRIDRAVDAQLDEILHHPRFQALEAAWRGVDDLLQHVNQRANIMVDLLDATKHELIDDFEANSVDVTEGALFKKVYRAEFDQFGGKPFGAMIGMFEVDCTPRDLLFLRQVGKVAALAHAPFITSVSPRFFGCDTAEQLTAVRDLEGLLRQPRYGAWEALRNTHEAAYVGLTLPRILMRRPWHPEDNPSGDLPYTEDPSRGDGSHYLWGNSALLFARNLARAYERTGWCQQIRGPRGGGLIEGLPAHRLRLRGESELKSPVEWLVPDHSELEFANAGFIPLIYAKNTDQACFFSCQSIKLPKQFKDKKDTENAQLSTNLSYTFSIGRIAHYLKCMMRDNVGTTADGLYVQAQIQNWLEEYVTTILNPDDLTLSFYPFKAARVEVKKTEGLIGQYSCSVAVLPHVQFEGIDVELRLESRLG